MPDETSRSGVSGSTGFSPDSPAPSSASERIDDGGPSGAIVMHPPELGPIEGMAIVKSMQRHLNRIGGERAELTRQVAKLHRENRSLSDEARHERRRAMLALESMEVLADSLAQAEDAGRVTREAFQTPLPADAWYEEIGPVLWWCFPVEEAPWCGTPLGSDWPGYHTHWTPLPGVAQPDGTPAQPTPMPARLIREARGA